MTRRVIAALAVIAATNIVLLSSARWNRSGNADAIVRLTERELSLPWNRSERNSADEVQFDFTPDPEQDRYLEAAKLEALGFDTHVPAEPKAAEIFFRHQLSRRAFGAYEFEGSAWTRYVQALQRRRATLSARDRAPDVRTQIDLIDREMRVGSRLFPVDAATDPSALRSKYPDRSRYLILPVTIHVFPSDHTIGGQMRLLTSTLVVPVQARPAIDRAAAAGRLDLYLREPGQPQGPRYIVTLAVGHNYEPWIVSTEAIDTASGPH
jgi:hypothetical protein